jgi:glycine/D-amino acid oxidase-like deaminating enzyme
LSSTTIADPRAYQEVSYWLSSAGPITPRPRLSEDIRADVAILGAGFTGLWTAYYLLLHEPGLKVVLLEQEIAGFGASGRNGGWCSPDLNASLNLLTRRFGVDRARHVMRAMYATVDEVGRVASAESIDADYEKAGVLNLARGPAQVPSVEAAYREYADAGFGDRYQVLSPEQCSELVRVSRVERGLFSPECAVVHPGKLVRGLAQVVERRGGVIYEQSPVIDFRTGASPALITASGRVHASTIVLAAEAYLTRFRRLHRRLLPIYSLIVMTEPLDETTLASIGWSSRVCLSSMRLTIDYLSRTRDRRILFGGRGAPYNFGSAIRPETENHAPTHQMLRRMFVDWFPGLKDVHFTHAWGGVLAMPRDWIPSISLNRQEGLASAGGYTGHGVATTNLAGRTLADLIQGRTTELTELPLVNHRSPDWEPEPLRWLGVRYVQRGLAAVDATADRTGRPPGGHSLAERLGGH